MNMEGEQNVNIAENSEQMFDGRLSLYAGDSAEVLKQFPDNHFDSVVTLF